jgi:hypothetical protein
MGPRIKEICGAGCDHADEAVEQVCLNFLPPASVLPMGQSQ